MPAFIDSHHGHLVKHTQDPFILVLNLGENLFEAIIRAFKAAELKAAALSGLGAVSDVKAAYYHLDQKTYETRDFKGMFELVSLTGNIAHFEGNPMAHIHAAISNPACEVFGGHIMDATVGASAEITITPLPDTLTREHSPSIGLRLLCPMAH
jgi:predicted DNA-binding protein with PD1-like motif